MPTRNVVLTDHQARLVARLVESGRYQNASEVLREGLRLIETREAEEAVKLEALRRDIDAAWREADRGAFADYSLDETLRALDAETAPRRNGQA